MSTADLTTLSPFNAALWRVVGMTGEGRSLEGYYSLPDSEPGVSFVSRPDGHERLEPLRSEAAVARLMWFSRGFFSGRELGSGEIVLSDLRMGFEERLVFSFVVGRREGEAIKPAPSAGARARTSRPERGRRGTAEQTQIYCGIQQRN